MALPAALPEVRSPAHHHRGDVRPGRRSASHQASPERRLSTTAAWRSGGAARRRRGVRRLKHVHRSRSRCVMCEDSAAVLHVHILAKAALGADARVGVYERAAVVLREGMEIWAWGAASDGGPM